MVLVLLDLSVAFNTLDHAALLARPKYHYGICGTMLRWFESYLVGRIQQVLVKGFLSSELELMYGVPQGSVLGTLLFFSVFCSY